MRSVLAAFYYGNLTRPSQDPPRIGLLSTVPSDGDERLKEAISAAEAAHAPLAGTCPSPLLCRSLFLTSTVQRPRTPHPLVRTQRRQRVSAASPKPLRCRLAAPTPTQLIRPTQSMALSLLYCRLCFVCWRRQLRSFKDIHSRHIRYHGFWAIDQLVTLYHHITALYVIAISKVIAAMV